MDINFSYTNNKGKLVCIEKYEPIAIEETFDSKAFLGLNKLRADFGFKKNEFLMILAMYARIRFTSHTTSSYLDEGTINQLGEPFFEPITTDTPRPRVRYMFRLSEKGVELYNTLDALLQVESGKEDAALMFIEGYIEYKKLA